MCISHFYFINLPSYFIVCFDFIVGIQNPSLHKSVQCCFVHFISNFWVCQYVVICGPYLRGHWHGVQKSLDTSCMHVVKPYKFKDAASALHSVDETWEIHVIDPKNGRYSTLISIVNVWNGVLWACSARSHFKPIEAPFFSWATGIIALRPHHMLIISCSTLA